MNSSMKIQGKRALGHRNTCSNPLPRENGKVEKQKEILYRV